MKIIAGPCQHESLEQSLQILKHCKDVCNSFGIEYYFKASFDKANRTNFSSKRGIGITDTLKDFCSIKEKTDVKILTDVHETKDVNIAEEYGCIDVYQVPAFLCRQTDLIRSCVETNKVVNIKKGQFLSPWDVEGILSKTKDAKEVWITERGTSFGYNTLVVDFTGIDYMIRKFGDIIFFDVTHSVQKPGGNGSSSGGDRSYVPGLCRAASALGVNNFFLEVHPDPDSSPSDGSNMIYLKDFEKIVKQIYDYNYTNTCKN
jgi:2-dehydro-3-deoxyphosphooctonate aldolase (KDO 8-P synthase)